MIFGINITRDISKLSQISYNTSEISLVVFMPNISTNHAITYTSNYSLVLWKNYSRFCANVFRAVTMRRQRNRQYFKWIQSSAVVSQTSYRGETTEVASRSVGCFLRLIIGGSNFTITLWRHSFWDVAYLETLVLTSFRANFRVIPEETAFGGIIPSISNCRLSITFTGTSNCKREFVPRDQVSPFCRLLFVFLHIN